MVRYWGVWWTVGCGVLPFVTVLAVSEGSWIGGTLLTVVTMLWVVRTVALVRKEDRMLKCETNTPEVEKQIKEAAEDRFGPDEFDTFYEHGQWWVRVFGRGDFEMTYSVVDASPGVLHGLDFEVV